MITSMSLIYITGIAGAGKSAVCDELVRRGYEAHEADNTLSNFYVNATGEIASSTTPAERTAEWREHHSWQMSKDKLLALKKTAASKPVFVCGVAANEEEYLDVFDKIFALTVDTETLVHRITTRDIGDFGKSEHEMKSLLEWQNMTEDGYKKIGAQVIDATRPLATVVDEIIANTSIGRLP